MINVQARIDGLPWESITDILDKDGIVSIEKVLTEKECEQIINMYPQPIYRKTVVMERYRFGKGEYKYFQYPLPPLLHLLRETIYSKIVSVANHWMDELKIDINYPQKHQQLIQSCHSKNQLQPTALILKYGEGGFNTLHQDLYGPVYFPFQVVIMLNEKTMDYQGGEFVITEQIPRAQSRAKVFTPGKGDALIFTTNFRPVKGSKGYYRANLKHGVSTVLKGERHALGIIFHDGLA